MSDPPTGGRAPSDDHAPIHFELPDDVDLDALEAALLRARSAELSEVRRRNVRLTAGYGDATAREAMDDEGRRAQARHDALSALLDAVRAVRAARDDGAVPA